MPIPHGIEMESSNRDSCVRFFKDLFTRDELREKIKQFSPDRIGKRPKNSESRKSLYELLGIEKINDDDKLASILYDVVGPHFLYEVQGASGPMDDSSKRLRYEIFKKAIDLGWFSIGHVSQSVSGIPYKSGISKIEDVMDLKIPGQWQHEMLKLLSHDLPSETAEAPSQNQARKNSIVTITPIRELMPLHDYQIFAGKKITDLLAAKKERRKRLLISIPTGAGKTRLVAESLVEWLNDGKPSDDPRIANAKYTVWIAQSRELCEQAISQFEEIYSHKGRSALTIFRLFGDHDLTLATVLAQRVEHGLIVCTIDKLYNQIDDKQNITEFNRDFFTDPLDYDDRVHKSNIPQKYYDDYNFGILRSMTFCIVVDEAHKAIMPTYTCVLRGFGFNFNYKDEVKINESGITLIGLTATAFRGTGLERSRPVRVGKQSGEKIQLVYEEKGIEKSYEIAYPLKCSVCKKTISEGDDVLQSTSKKQLVWHHDEEKLSAETMRIYSRFSRPLIPKIYAFQENRKPKAIITCNEKTVAKDPVRISGEKSYDLLGGISKYTWKIERKSNLTEVFGIEEKKENAKIPKPLPSIVEELDKSGTYKITLTVENYDGFADTATKMVNVIAPEETKTSNNMKDLIQNLIKREILCEVFHSYIKSGKLDVKGDSKDSIDIGGRIRKLAAENDSRNEKMVKTVHYLLTVPKEKRRKILVFACDILHARLLALWLRTKYNVEVDYVDSKLHASRNIARIRKFREKSEEKGKVLINTNMLTTGFDVPDVDCVVMGRPVISTVEYTQMIGRGMRGPRMGGTKEVWIIDFDDQVQLSERMQSQAIPLGWKSMAYDQNQNLIWKPLSEKTDYQGNPLDLEMHPESEESPDVSEVMDGKAHGIAVRCRSCRKQFVGVEEISLQYGLTTDEQDDLNRLVGEGITPELTSLKYCKECKDAIKIYPDSNDPWRNLAVQEKEDPVLLHMIKSFTQDDSPSQKIDITKFNDVKTLLSDIIRSYNTKKTELEMEPLSEDDVDILRDLIHNAKQKISRSRLGVFWTDHIILQQNIRMKKRLAELCDHLIDTNILFQQLSTIKQNRENQLPPEERLHREMERLIFDELGYIPEEKEFRKYVGEELYQHMLKKYFTYHQFQIHIGINEYLVRLHERSNCLSKVIQYCNRYEREPDVAALEKIIPEFKQKTQENFNSISSFLDMVRKISDSARHANKNITFAELKKDFEDVKSKTPWNPSIEEILRHSRLGIGNYMRYAGTVENFQELYDLDEETRKKFETLKKKYFEIKKSLNGIPDEDTIRKYTDYSSVVEYLWFESYDKFLETIGENPEAGKHGLSAQSGRTKEELISEAKAFVKRNGMQELFEKIATDSEFKYTVTFGGVEKFIEKAFPDNKQVALIKWKDFKNRLKAS